MNQQPDKLFRDKLQSFQTPAPSGAWSRIEANLEKKNEKVLWFRIAASLLLVAIAAYLLWPSKSLNTPQPGIAGKTQKEQQATPVQKQQDKIISVPAPDETKIARQEKTNVKPSLRREKKNLEKEEQESTVAQETRNATESNGIVQNEMNDERALETIADQAETQTVVVANAETQKVKIIFSANEVDNKYLDKKALAEATSDDKKPSTLKKLLDKAYDLKYNQDPFGDLRQRKDEILALNFRKDKRSDNK